MENHHQSHFNIHTSTSFALFSGLNLTFVLRQSSAQEIASQFEVYLDILELNFPKYEVFTVFSINLNNLFIFQYNNSLTIMFKSVSEIWRAYLSSSLDIPNCLVGATEQSSQVSGDF